MIDVGAVLADAARFMPDKAAPAIKRGIVALRPLQQELTADAATTELLPHKDFRKAMRSLSSFHERAGRG